MTNATLLMLMQYGPGFVEMALKVWSDIQAGKGQTVVTPDEIAALLSVAKKTSAQYLAEAGGAPHV